MTIFADTSVWYAAADRTDIDNRRAQALLRGGPIVTTDHVLIETWRLLCFKVHYEAAERFWDALRKGVARVEMVGAPDLEVARQIGRDFQDQRFSIVDRTSFAVMHRLGIAKAASFDDDFAIYRFGPGRRRAFEVMS